jgi:hypothetical protein
MPAHAALTLGLLAWTILAREAEAQTAPVPAGSGRIAGRVVSIASGSIADAVVTLTRLDGSTSSPLTLTTDRHGAFAFERVRAGRYRVSASKPGYTNRQPLNASAERFDTGRELTIRDREHVPPIELTLYRESSIAGRIAEPDGIPAPDVQVFAAVRRGATYVRLDDTRTVAEWNGRYRITGLPPGDYLIVILPSVSTDPNRMRINAERRAPESSSATRPFFEPTFYPGTATVDSAESVTVFEGIPVDGIDTWLEPGERHSISGRISWPAGTTAEHIVIEYANLTAQRSGIWTVPEPGDLFHITGVPRGTVVLLARADSNRGPLAGVVTTARPSRSGWARTPELRVYPRRHCRPGEPASPARSNRAASSRGSERLPRERDNHPIRTPRLFDASPSPSVCSFKKIDLTLPFLLPAPTCTRWVSSSTRCSPACSLFAATRSSKCS